MSNGQPKTDPAKALSELLAVLQQRADLKWPEDTLATARREFNETLGQFLRKVGAERPDLDLWGGKEAKPLHDYMVRTVVPAIADHAAAGAPASRVITPDALSKATHTVMTDKKIVDHVHELIRELALAIRERIAESICRRDLRQGPSD